MEISLLGKPKAPRPQTAQDPPKVSKGDEDGKGRTSRRVDSSDISAGHVGAFEDKRLTVAKSAVLYDVSLSAFTEKLEEIRDAVESGTYSVPDDALADALLG